MKTSSPLRGRILILSSAMALALMGLCVKAIPASMSSNEKVFFRSLVGAVIVLAWMGANPGRAGRPVNRRGLVLRGAVGAVALLCFFYSIDHVGLGRATLYYFTYPIWAAALCWSDARERPSPAILGWLLTGMAGVAVTMLPSASAGGGWNLVFGRGDVVGLIGGAFSGYAIITVRRLHKTDNSTWIVLAFTAASTLISAPLLPAGFVVPGPSAAVLLLLTGLLAVASQWLMTAGYARIAPVEGSLYGLAAVPFSAVLAVSIMGEPAGFPFWAGSTVVMAATVGATLMPGTRKPTPQAISATRPPKAATCAPAQAR